MAELCRICNTRRPRRRCPGVDGDICAPCCGTEREVTVTCPLDCEYLLEARKHEKPLPLTTALHPDVEITEGFLERHELLFAAVTQHLVQAALKQPGVIDSDMRDMLAATIRTAETADSGLIYTTHAENAVATAVQEAFQQGFGEWRAMVEKRGVDAGMEGPLVKDADVRKVLVFLHRLSYQFNNQRPKGRSFLSVVLDWTRGLEIRPKEPEPEA